MSRSSLGSPPTNRSTTRIATLAVVALLSTTVGCSRGSRDLTKPVGSPSATPAPTSDSLAAFGSATPPVAVRRSAAPRTTPRPSPPARVPGQSVPKPPPAPKGTPPPEHVPTDDGPLGSNAFFFLNARVPRLVIEIDAVEGFEPSRGAIDLLVERLRSVCSKPDGVRVPPYGRIQGRETWTIGDVRRAEKASRTARNSSSQAVMHVLYLNGAPDQGGAIGVAYGASGAAIFIEEIRANALPTVPAEDVEKASLVHEAGHLLSLVNLGYESPRDHEDPEHEGHSTNPDSVMYPVIDNVGVFTLFQGLGRLPPTDFDADDRADLADVKKGALP